jgi:hypothetical protein
MEIATIFASVKGAIDAVKKISEITKKMRNAELKSVIADLSNQLADTSQKLADLKHEFMTLRTENETLKAKDKGPKPTIQWDCYKFAGEQGLYCRACYDVKGQKSPMTRVNSQSYRCLVCKTLTGA